MISRTVEKAAEIIEGLTEAGIKHVSFKPASADGIRQVINIAASNPHFSVVFQWTGGGGAQAATTHARTSTDPFSLPTLLLASIQLVGGCTRIPAVRAKIQPVLPGMTPYTTTNQAEVIARGTTFSSAAPSPVFCVHDLAIHDIQPYPIKVSWEKAPEDPDEDTELVIFPKGNGIPSTKVLTFYHNEPFEIRTSYAEPSDLPGKMWMLWYVRRFAV